MFIEINGKEVGLKYGMVSVEVLSKMNGNAGRSDIANIIKIIWAGIENYYFIKDTQPPVTLEDVNEYVEDISFNGDPEGVTQKVLIAFTESRPVKQLIDKSEEAKKKTLMSQQTSTVSDEPPLEN